MSARKRINKTKFYAINRDVKAGYSVKCVASNHNVSEETVRTVKRAKTWPRFEAMKKLKNEQRRPTQVKETITNIPQPVLFTPQDELDEITQAPENQIRPLPPTAIKVVTVKEWEDLNRKLGDLYSLTSRRQGLFSFLLGRK